MPTTDAESVPAPPPMRPGGAAAGVLFAAMFASQAAVVAMAPVLDQVGRDLGVATATAGQLRTLGGLVAALVGFQIPRLAARFGLRSVLASAAALLALGDLGSAVAPTFALLAAAQVLIGAGVAGVVAAGTAAVGAWAGDAERTRVLSWALIGQPAAWIVGMPLAGVLGQSSWRLCWLVLPLGSALLATMLLLAMPAAVGQRSTPGRLRPVLADRAIARWGLAELLFNCAWSGTLVYAGTLFAESYDSAASTVGLILGSGAGIYVCGNLAARRLAARQPHQQLVALALLLAVLVTAFDGARLGVWASAALFGLTALVGGARTLVGGAVGLSVTPEARLAAMGLRTAAVQIGSVVGTGISGIALTAGGYGALGVTLAALFAGSAAALVELRVRVTRLQAVGEG